MSITLIVQLLSTFGPGAVALITALISKWETNGTVSSAEWSQLTAAIGQNAQAVMLAQLKTAGIDPTSPQGQAMLALAK